MTPPFAISSDTFYQLMPHRVQEVLLVASRYDAFILEERGHLFEQIWDEYHSLNVVTIPRMTRVSTLAEARSFLESHRVDLIVTMQIMPDGKAEELAVELARQPAAPPVIRLLNDPSYVPAVEEQGAGPFTATFFMEGESGLFFAMMKSVEDRLNAVPDVATGLVKVILIVEDSVRDISELLPHLYGEVLKQTSHLVHEGRNDLQQLVLRRCRPKLLHARNMEEAEHLLATFSGNMLGIVSDVAFPIAGQVREHAGFELARLARTIDRYVPIILMSSDQSNRHRAEQLGCSFATKRTTTFIQDLRTFIIESLGFGDFIFRTPDGEEVRRAGDLRSFLLALEEVPGASILYHAARNHFSTWLMARGEHAIAMQLRPLKVHDFEGDPARLRQHILQVIDQHQEQKHRGFVAHYRPGDWESPLVQLGHGSPGGKGRSLAFMEQLLAEWDLTHSFPSLRVYVPRSVIIACRYYEDFRVRNAGLIREEGSDEEIRASFLKGKLSPTLSEALADFLKHSHRPLAVRSSSLLEDSHYLPFAGIYATYMIPNLDPDPGTRLAQLEWAVKLTYASVFSNVARAYMASTPQKQEDEKMGVVIQEIVGNQYGDRVYPHFSGVAQSYNYYPQPHTRPEDGVVQIALGLGHTIVDGGGGLRFVPRRSHVLAQFATPKEMLQQSQKTFYALDCRTALTGVEVGEELNLRRCNLEQAEQDGVLQQVASRYDIDNDRLTEHLAGPGPLVVTFANTLRYHRPPLAPLMATLLPRFCEAMGRDVELEFAGRFPPVAGEPAEVALLQLRPLAVRRGGVRIEETDRDPKRLLCHSDRVLGNGRLNGIHDILLVDPETFHPGSTPKMAEEIGRLNAQIKRPYLLLGIGRWGSRDSWLGIPVRWDHIDHCAAIVETDTPTFAVSPSQGTHFFQNIVAREIPFFSISVHVPHHHLDWEYLKGQPRAEALDFVHHLKLEHPLTILVDGLQGEGVILKPPAD